MIVVDTNILAYRWLPGPRSEAADALADLDPQWAAPLLWRSEFRSVLAGYIRLGVIDLEAANLVVRNAALCLQAGEHQVEDWAVLELVARSKCSAYDCEYVALALALHVPLVTEDKALLQSFPSVCRDLKTALND